MNNNCASYPQVRLVLGLKNCLENNSYLKSATPTFSPQTIELKHLENAEIALQLSNKIGYGGQEKAKAIVTYQVENQVRIIELETVTVNKN